MMTYSRPIKAKPDGKVSSDVASRALGSWVLVDGDGVISDISTRAFILFSALSTADSIEPVIGSSLRHLLGPSLAKAEKYVATLMRRHAPVAKAASGSGVSAPCPVYLGQFLLPLRLSAGISWLKVEVTAMGPNGTAPYFLELADHTAAMRSIGNATRYIAVHERSEQQQSEFYARVSNEMKMPLNAIIGFSEIIDNSVLGPIENPTYRDYISDIRHSGEQLLILIDDVLEFARLHVGNKSIDELLLIPHRMVATCLRQVDTLARQLNIELKCDMPSNLPLLFADERRLRRVLVGLLENALQFTPSGGRVVLRCGMTASGDMAFAIQDSSAGISPEELATIALPFSKRGRPVHGMEYGSGLGIPLAKTVAELHGGTLQVASTPGTGTTITLTLPGQRVRRMNLADFHLA